MMCKNCGNEMIYSGRRDGDLFFYCEVCGWKNMSFRKPQTKIINDAKIPLDQIDWNSEYLRLRERDWDHYSAKRKVNEKYCVKK